MMKVLLKLKQYDPKLAGCFSKTCLQSIAFKQFGKFHRGSNSAAILCHSSLRDYNYNIFLGNTKFVAKYGCRRLSAKCKLIK